MLDLIFGVRYALWELLVDITHRKKSLIDTLLNMARVFLFEPGALYKTTKIIFVRLYRL